LFPFNSLWQELGKIAQTDESSFFLSRYVWSRNKTLGAKRCREKKEELIQFLLTLNNEVSFLFFDSNQAWEIYKDKKGYIIFRIRYVDFYIQRQWCHQFGKIISNLLTTSIVKRRFLIFIDDDCNHMMEKWKFCIKFVSYGLQTREQGDFNNFWNR